MPKGVQSAVPGDSKERLDLEYIDPVVVVALVVRE